MQIDAAQCDVGALAELKAVERHTIEARRLFRCERIGGSVASTCGVVDRLVRRTNRRRLDKVIREIGERRVGTCLCQPLNDLAHSLVQPASTGRAQFRVHGLPNERMKEAESTRGAGLFPDQVGRYGFVEGVEEVIFGEIAKRLQHAKVKFAAHNRGHGERLLTAFRRSRQPAPDHVADALRQSELGHRHRAFPTHAFDGTAFVQVTEHLAYEERVAGGDLAEKRRKVERIRPHHGGNQVAHLSLGEPAHR